MDGFVKLARCLLDKPVLQNANLLQVWIWCLLKATHKEHEQLVGLRKVPLQPGQFITGRFKGSSELKMKPSTFRNCLEWLKDNQSISIKVDTKFSLVSIVNWQVYQVEMFSDGQQKDSKRTANGQQMDTNKNVKNVKNDKNIKTYSDYTANSELIEALTSFEEMRKSIKKPLTDKAIKMLLNKLDGLAKTDQQKIEVLNQSTMNCWQGIFEIKQDQLKGKPVGSIWSVKCDPDPFCQQCKGSGKIKVTSDDGSGKISSVEYDCDCVKKKAI